MENKSTYFICDKCLKETHGEQEQKLETFSYIFTLCFDCMSEQENKLHDAIRGSDEK